MSIPLVQEATKDAINTSIIAIKRNIERINMLLGLVDSGSPDLSGLATKQELEDAVNSLQPVNEVAVDNMHSVTSNAVAKQTVRNTYMDCFHFDGNGTQAQLYELLTSRGIINDTDNTTVYVVGNINGASFNNILQYSNVRYLRRDTNNVYNISKTSTSSVNVPINIIYSKLS